MVQVKDKAAGLLEADRFDPDAWVADILRACPQLEGPLVRKAVRLAIEAHRDQVRASGEPYVRHVLAVAEILADLQLDQETVAAAVLHDVVEDTDVALEQIRAEFGPSVARLVDGVTKMDVLGEYPEQADASKRKEWANAESLRKMLLAMAEDVRVILIKLADRLHNMRTLGHLDEARRKRIARETLDIYAPLANRLGIWQIKWELEDLSFRYLDPEGYKYIARMLDERRVDRERYIARVVELIQKKLRELNIRAEVTGRPKHIYSIGRKMERKDIGFDQVFDVRAVRILVASVADCYAALGAIHSMWQHIPKEFDDYIATPKENHYQSLHTAVVGPEGKNLEIQIRTYGMHEQAELGVAAHWSYKEGARFDASFDAKVAWLRQLLEWKDEEASAGDFIDRFKAEVFEDRVYVLTPKGNVVDLAAGSTPLDFAYYIHTDVGHRCRGAKVDGNIVPLTYELKNGDQVEILTTRNGLPSRDWLNPHLGYLKTSRARAKVRAWFRQQEQGKNVAEGRVSLERELHRLGMSDVSLEKLARRFGFERTEELFAAVGRGEISGTQIAGAAQDQVLPAPAPQPVPQRPEQPETAPAGDVRIEGVGNLMTSIARCCKPVPSDPIIGYITRGRGVTIHRRDCPNVLRLGGQAQERLIEVSWGSTVPSHRYPVDVQVLAYDRQDLLRDLTAVLSNEKIYVRAMQTRTSRTDPLSRIELMLEIQDAAQLSRVLAKLSQLPNVIEARRQGEGSPEV